jgi:tRNA threonylcarbamoyladenosine biosynthesis protein TsaB
MRVLALDSTSRAGSVAIVDDDHVWIERRGDDSRTLAERLPAEINHLGAPLASVDLFAVASGPGSFTGMRVGIATIQGLAFAMSKRVAPISALETLAQIGSRDLAPGTLVGAWMDAHRREVFSALFIVTDARLFSSERLTELDPARVGAPADILARWTESRWAPGIVLGDGAALYRNLLDGRAHVPEPPLLAGALGLMAVDRAKRGRTVDPAGVQPLYIRRPDAELERERRLERSEQESLPRTDGTPE